MNSLRVETIVQNDGELFFPNVPCHKGDRVEAILILPEDDVEKKKSGGTSSLYRTRLAFKVSIDRSLPYAGRIA